MTPPFCYIVTLFLKLKYIDKHGGPQTWIICSNIYETGETSEPNKTGEPSDKSDTVL